MIHLMYNRSLGRIIVTGLIALMTGTVVGKDKQKVKFEGNDESLKQYAYPEWFRDAKLGFWAHWGPQSVIEKGGDWYPKSIYINNWYDRKNKKFLGRPHPDYITHQQVYGHPSVFGYKDIAPLWKAENWDPFQLMKLYKEVGAKYFVTIGVHHDNYDLFDSGRRWSSVAMGPKQDVVELWQKAAKKEGLRFGISEHLGASYTWFQTSHGADSVGPYAGVPYDGQNPEYHDLYHSKADPDDTSWLTKNPVWQKEWYDRMKFMLDKFQPDLFYSDSHLPFGDIGRDLIAHYYNRDLEKNNGKLEAVYNCKEPSHGRFVDDVERGVKKEISEFPWQTDTSLGAWFYRKNQRYKTADEVIQMLVDIVSKNGNLLINIVQKPDGTLDEETMKTLDGIGKWMKVNGEAIYKSRPWKIFGEKPEEKTERELGQFDENFGFDHRDLRFTTRDGYLYVFCLGHPTDDIVVRALAAGSPHLDKKISSVSMLGSRDKIKWSQNNHDLTIVKPAQFAEGKVVTFKIKFK